MDRKKFKILWGIMMTLLYLGMACLIAFSDIFHIGKGLSIIMAILFFIYGIFRGYRVWKEQ